VSFSMDFPVLFLWRCSIGRGPLVLKLLIPHPSNGLIRLNPLIALALIHTLTLSQTLALTLPLPGTGALNLNLEPLHLLQVDLLLMVLMSSLSLHPLELLQSVGFGHHFGRHLLSTPNLLDHLPELLRFHEITVSDFGRNGRRSG